MKFKKTSKTFVFSFKEIVAFNLEYSIVEACFFYASQSNFYGTKQTFLR